MRRLESWADITLRDVAIAYHKAKCDAFFERSTVDAVDFATYEEDLQANLEQLATTLQAGEAHAILHSGSSGFEVVPKKLRWKPSATEEHAEARAPWIQASAERRFEQLKSDHLALLELRACARFSVDAHVIGALWINLIGHRFDVTLGSCSYGSRLRRYRSQTERGSPRRDYHLECPGSFEPYVHPYRRWRNDAMRRVRAELDDGKDVLVLMLDLSSYYHRVDPYFIVKDGFVDEVEKQLDEGERFTAFERKFTEVLARSFAAWGASARGAFGLEPAQHWGLPIGSAAARVFANVLLLRWDRAVEHGLAPLFYGRYVDDMILVLRDSAALKDAETLFGFLAARIHTEAGSKLLRDLDSGTRWGIEFGDDYAGSSSLTFHAGKLRVFSLSGDSGKDFLATLDREAQEVSSERRLLPDPDLLEKSFAARLLTATEQPGDDADSFRRAGMLSVRRFAWSVNLRKAEILSLDLPPDAWSSQRVEFYRFARTHMVCADKLLNHTDTLGRLLGLSVACGDWKETAQLLARTQAAVDGLVDPVKAGTLKVNGDELKWPPVMPEEPDILALDGWTLAWVGLRAYLGRVAYQAVARAWTSSPPCDERDRFGGVLARVCDRIGRLGGSEVAPEEIEKAALSVLRGDLARRPIADVLAPTLDPPVIPAHWLELEAMRASDEFLYRVFGGEIEASRFDWVLEFVDVIASDDEAEWPRIVVKESLERDLTSFFFSTRPVSPSVIAHTIPEVVAKNPIWATFPGNREIPDRWKLLSPVSIWAGLLRALRGVAVNGDIFGGPAEADPPVVALRGRNVSSAPESMDDDDHSHRHRPTLALANARSEDAWWEGSAAGQPVETVDRYKRLATLVNDALNLRPAPEYLALPELFLPRRLARSVAKFVNGAGINLISGVEYGHGAKLSGSSTARGGSVANQAMLSLIDTRLGFPYVIELWQTKTVPAPHEGERLHSVHGKKWNGGAGAKLHPHDPKPVYHHENLYFGVLLCSELRNMNYRAAFQGEVDLLLVPSWNQDLLTFVPLVESAALDVHSYVGLVNNARYGDTRLRVPAREPHERDVCRVRGGLNDYIVVAELYVDVLRKFHSHHLDWPHAEDRFKPVPEGFRVSKARWRVPGTSKG